MPCLHFFMTVGERGCTVDHIAIDLKIEQSETCHAMHLGIIATKGNLRKSVKLPLWGLIYLIIREDI